MKVERKKEFKKVKVEHNKKLLWIIGVLVVILIATIVFIRVEKSKIEVRENLTNNSFPSQIANPASAFCIEMEGSLELITNDSGSIGLCTLPNGDVCEEWALFRGECGDLRDSCSKDFDCVPASCCHPTACVNKINAPNCDGMKCTMECALGTLDCGQGSCRCVNNKCSVQLNS